MSDNIKFVLPDKDQAKRMQIFLQTPQAKSIIHGLFSSYCTLDSQCAKTPEA